MDNIYSQSVFERNSIVELPDGFADRAGGILYSWLGDIWRHYHSGDGMVRGLQRIRGIRLAQLYLDILEAAKLQDRFGAPVFHRELWHPIVIRKSDRDKSQENMLEIGGNAELGPQPEGSVYGEGTVLKMGKIAEFEKYVTYPIDSGIVGMAKSVVDNIVNPTVSMENGKDFVFRNNSIIFARENDPLSESSPFDKVDIPSEDPSDPDVECVLWASDVLIDRDYVADHLSYVLGANAPSTDVVKRIVNASWSSVASGLTPELAKTLIAAMLNVPVIRNDRETVLSVEMSTDEETGMEVQLVETDKGVYRVSPKATLRRSVFAGSVLKRGDLLDESLRIYPFLNNVEVEAREGSSSSGENGVELVVSYDDTGFSVPLEQDIPSVVLPTDVLRVRTKYGLYAMWGGSVVRASSDGNGNHLYFDVGGEPDDVKSFWKGVWDRADEEGIDLSRIVGNVGDIVSPAAFFMNNLIGANTMFVVIDLSQVDSAEMVHNPMFFGMLSSVVPSAIRLFVIEHRSVRDDKRLGDSGEETHLAAALPGIVDDVPEMRVPGLEGRGPSFGDSVSARLVRPTPQKRKGRKEEE